MTTGRGASPTGVAQLQRHCAASQRDTSPAHANLMSMTPSKQGSVPGQRHGLSRTIRISDVAIATIPMAVGLIGGLASRDGIGSWYRTMERPSWNPPDWVFGPVWTTLYAMMGIALADVVRSDRDRIARQAGIGLFAVQLMLNFGWSWIFFVDHDLDGALVEVIALWLAVAATTAAFSSARPRAGWLLVPYLAWVSFATILTASIWRLNR